MDSFHVPWIISIHSLHTEGDLQHSTVPSYRHISIHSLHTEGDFTFWKFLQIVVYFNPLPPHGGRLKDFSKFCRDFVFQSTPSTRRETSARVDVCRRQDISIHSLHTEGDAAVEAQKNAAKYFNPLPPHGGRPMGQDNIVAGTAFQSTPSAWRETRKSN